MTTMSSTDTLKKTFRNVPMVRQTYLAFKEMWLGRNFRRQFLEYKKLVDASGARLPMEWADRWPCMWESQTESIGFEPHYLFHPAWAARVLAETKPEKHIDIGSTLPFNATVSAFVPIDFYEWRPTELGLSNLRSLHADLMKLPFETGSVTSLSCMHTLEHVGIGRYGDPVDVDGDLKAIAELKRVIAPGGDLLIVVPMGRGRIRYNADRVYDYKGFREYFSEFEVKEFAFIMAAPGGGRLIRNATEADVAKDDSGCGCFWFRKP
jgi:SAM-dependent methyltransferase